MIHNNIRLIFLVFVLVFSCSNAYGQSQDDPTLTNAAHDALDDFVNILSNTDNIDEMIDIPKESIAESYLGEGMVLRTVSFQSLVEKGTFEILNSVYWFPVYFGGQVWAALEMTTKNGKWIPLRFGGFQTTSTTMNEIKAMKSNKTFSTLHGTSLMSLLQIAVIGSTFLDVDNQTSNYLIPLGDNRKYVNNTSFSWQSKNEIINTIRTIYGKGANQ